MHQLHLSPHHHDLNTNVTFLGPIMPHSPSPPHRTLFLYPYPIYPANDLQFGINFQELENSLLDRIIMRLGNDKIMIGSLNRHQLRRRNQFLDLLSALEQHSDVAGSL